MKNILPLVITVFIFLSGAALALENETPTEHLFARIHLVGTDIMVELAGKVDGIITGATAGENPNASFKRGIVERAVAKDGKSTLRLEEDFLWAATVVDKRDNLIYGKSIEEFPKGCVYAYFPAEIGGRNCWIEIIAKKEACEQAIHFANKLVESYDELERKLDSKRIKEIIYKFMR